MIFSSTLTEPLVWPNARLVTTDAVEAVRAMKVEGDLPLRTLGSVRLCRSLLAAGLVDRFRLVVFPVITGATGHDRVYDGYPDVALELVESRTFDGRSQLLDYVPACSTVRPAPAEPEARGPRSALYREHQVGDPVALQEGRRVAEHTSVMPIAPK